MDGDLLDRIYESVLEPDVWDEVLRRLADELGAEGGALIWQNIYSNDAEGIFARTDPEAVALFAGHFATRNPLRPTAAEVRQRIKAWKPRIVLDEERLPKAEFVKTEFYNDFFRRFDFHSSAAIGLELDGDHAGTLDFLKSRRAGEFNSENLELIRECQPHLSRAFKLCRNLGTTHVAAGSSFAKAFDDWVQGVLVLTANRRVLYCNAAGDALARVGTATRIVNERLSLVDNVADERFEVRLRMAFDPDQSRRMAGFVAAPRADDGLALSVSVTPLRAERHQMFSQPGVLVTVTDPARELVLSPQKLRDVFGLTATEIKVAIGLFGGRPSGAVADELGISVNTVRNHLARILDKTHSSGQAELSRKLMSLA